jgi:hypothetical protein
VRTASSVLTYVRTSVTRDCTLVSLRKRNSLPGKIKEHPAVSTSICRVSPTLSILTYLCYFIRCGHCQVRLRVLRDLSIFMVVPLLVSQRRPTNIVSCICNGIYTKLPHPSASPHSVYESFSPVSDSSKIIISTGQCTRLELHNRRIVRGNMYERIVCHRPYEIIWSQGWFALQGSDSSPHSLARPGSSSSLQCTSQQPKIRKSMKNTTPPVRPRVGTCINHIGSLLELLHTM